MPLETISQIPDGPPAIGPYSPIVMGEGRFAFLSGQIPFDPEAGQIVRGTVAEQTRIVLTNLKRAVEAAGATLADVASCRVFIQGLSTESFAEMNGVYSEFFADHKPARTTVGADLLNFDVEIEAVILLS